MAKLIRFETENKRQERRARMQIRRNRQIRRNKLEWLKRHNAAVLRGEFDVAHHIMATQIEVRA
jgi:hypothetical protein